MFRMERKLKPADLFFVLALAVTLSAAIAVCGWKLVEVVFNSTAIGHCVGAVVFVLSMFMVRYLVRGLADTATP